MSREASVPAPSTRERLDLRGADAEIAEGAVDCDVALLAHEDADPRCSLETVAGEIPAGAVEHVVPCCGEGGHVRQSGSR